MSYTTAAPLVYGPVAPVFRAFSHVPSMYYVNDDTSPVLTVRNTVAGTVQPDYKADENADGGYRRVGWIATDRATGIQYKARTRKAAATLMLQWRSNGRIRAELGVDYPAVEAAVTRRALRSA